MEEKNHGIESMAVKSGESSMSSSFSLCVMLMVFLLVDVGVSQNCGCSSGLCCSQYGYCGTGNAYCGEGCREGPCNSSPSAASSPSSSPSPYSSPSPSPSPDGSVSSIITADVFSSIVGEAGSGCEGKGFYNYNAFIDAANAFKGFGTSGSSDVKKRELAAFFGNAAHETGGFCFINEKNPRMNYCDSSNTQYPCQPGKSYHGRGPLQLSWNYNYGPAGKYLKFDGLNNPDIVATDATISFKTTVWFWMMDSNCHKAITYGQGFGATIRAINGMECDGHNSGAVDSRVGYYRKFCKQLNVDPGSDLRC